MRTLQQAADTFATFICSFSGQKNYRAIAIAKKPIIDFYQLHARDARYRDVIFRNRDYGDRSPTSKLSRDLAGA